MLLFSRSLYIGLFTVGGLEGCYSDVNYGPYVWSAGQRSDPKTESEFIWNATLSRAAIPFGYTKWDERQPDYFKLHGGSESCVNVWPDRGSTWNDERCSNEYCFVCELTY